MALIPSWLEKPPAIILPHRELIRPRDATIIAPQIIATPTRKRGPTFDAVSTASTAASTSLSWSHTCTGSNLILIVGVAVGVSSATASVTSITYNGVALTDCGIGFINSNNTNAGGVQLFYQLNPPTGAHTIAVTCSATGFTSLAGGGISIANVNQSTPFAHTASNFGNSAAPSVTIVSAVGRLVVDVACNGDFSMTSNKTLEWRQNVNSSSAAGFAAGSLTAGAASVAMGYSISSADFWAIIAVDVQS